MKANCRQQKTYAKACLLSQAAKGGKEEHVKIQMPCGIEELKKHNKGGGGNIEKDHAVHGGTG